MDDAPLCAADDLRSLDWEVVLGSRCESNPDMNVM
jgi:hypothetical protein